MDTITIAILLAVATATAYILGKKNGIDQGINIAQEFREDRIDTKRVMDKIMTAIEEMVILPKETRQAIKIKIYLILEDLNNE